jgi:hypothetical protein
MRAGTRELEAYVWVMVKRLGAVNAREIYHVALRINKCIYFYAENFAMTSTTKRAPAERGSARERNERVAGAFGGRLGKVG